MRNVILSISLIISFSFLHAQTTWQSEKRIITESWSVDSREFEAGFNATIRHIEAPFPGGESARTELQKRKQEVEQIFPRSNNNALKPVSRTGQSISVGDSFAVTSFYAGSIMNGGRPNDNTIAISNDGKLLTSWNSLLWGYDIENDTFMFNFEAKHPSFAQYITYHSDTIVGLSFPFDPKLIYDPVHDRFIFVFLTGRNPENSGVIVGFSQTNNPNSVWKVYHLSGNPLDDNTWTDYPQIAINNHSLYLSLNQLYPDSSWITGFAQTIVWQMDLESAFNGADELPTKLWSGANYQGSKLRYLRPAKSGLGPDSDEMYFIANRPFNIQNDSVFLVKLTGDVFDNAGTATTQLAMSNIEYGMPPNGQQVDGSVLLTNDARSLGAVRMQDEIQFVGNTVDPATGNVGVFHGIIEDVNNPSVNATIISDVVRDYGYPNIAFMGEYIESRDVLIFFNHTSNSDFAGNSAVFFNSDREYGPINSLIEGESNVDMLTGDEERWGDYSGIQRVFNQTSKAWVAGYYGHGSDNAGTWVSEINGPNNTPQGILADNKSVEISTFPNPTNDWAYVIFSTEKTAKTKFVLKDVNGRFIQTLAYDLVKAGKNEFRFNLRPLESGTYFLQIQTEDEVLAIEKIIRY